MIVREKIEELDSFESYFKVIYRDETSLIIAYFNLGISEHSELNLEEKLKYIDRAYLVCEDITFLSINNCVIKNLKINSPSFYFGGFDLNNNDDEKINDIEVKANNIYLKLPDNFIISNSLWSPFKVDNNLFKVIPKSKVDNLLEFKNYLDSTDL